MQSTPYRLSVGTLPHLQVRLLGGFSVAVDGKEIPAARWPSLRATQLVQLLSLQPRRRMAREQVIDALWPQLGPEAGAANLRKAVFGARQALGRHGGIALQVGELALWPDGPTTLDFQDFEQQADAALRQGDISACAILADSYPGDLLPGARYEAWTEPSRERLEASYLGLLRTAGRWERLAEQDPTDEPAHRALIQRELEAGNRSAAIRWYARLREALQDSLGVLPDSQTQGLYEQCLAGLQTLGPPFVGRADLLAQSLACLGMPRSARPGGLVLNGPAGIGKSALCREIDTQAVARGWKVIRIDAAAPGRPYAVIAALAERLILDDRMLLDRVGVQTRAVLALINPVAEPADPLPGPLGRHQVVGAIRRLLLARYPESDILLQVDDAHLVDDADADVMVQLAMAGPPLCLLLAMRPPRQGSALSRGVSRLQRAAVLRQLDLQPLTDDESRRLVVRSVDPVPPDDVVSRIVQAAEGNPFAAITLSRSSVRATGGRLPGSAAEAIAERLCDVRGDAAILLNWVSLIGDDLDVGTIEAVARLAQVLPLPALDVAMEAGVLVVCGGGYRFRHDLVRQALVGQVPPHRRSKMHRQIAAQLAELDSAPAVVAWHWLEGGAAREALPWLVAAAKEASRLAAFSDAVRHLEPVLALQPAHADALRIRAEALDAMGDPAALAAYRLAAEASGEPASHDLRAKAALAQVKQGDPKGGLLALVGLRPSSVDGRLCEALAYAGAAALGAGDPAIGTAKAALARRLALESGDTGSLVIASWAQAAAAHARGELHRSVWADLQETSHVPHLALRVFDGHLCITQRFLYGSRPYPEVIRFAETLSAEAQRLGAARGYAFGITLRGEAEWLAGDLVAARTHLVEGARLHRAIGGPVGEALSLQRLAEVSLHEGKRDEAKGLIDEALDVARQTDIGFHLLDRIYGTRIRFHLNDPAAALNVLEDASESVRGPLETCPGCRITFAVPAAIAAARAGELALAERHEDQCAYLANVVMRLPAWYAAHDEVKGHLSLARGSLREARRFFAAAAKRFQDAGQPLDAQRCEQS